MSETHKPQSPKEAQTTDHQSPFSRQEQPDQIVNIESDAIFHASL